MPLSPPIRTPADDPDLIHLRLSAQAALLGEIGPHTLAVSVSYRGNVIVFDALVEPEATLDEREGLDSASAGIVAGYPAGWMLETNIRSGVDDLPGWPNRVFQRSRV